MYRFFLLLLALLGTACSNSPTVVGPLYNQLDNRMVSSMQELAEFDRSQIDAFEQLVSRFHFWHRRDQLPEYANLLEDVAARLRTPGAIPASQTDTWVQNVEGFTQRFRECHPLNFATEIIRSLSDEQLADIRQSIGERRKKFRERYNETTREERVERRFNNTIKWSGWIGFKFNQAQRRLLRETLERQISLRREQFKLSDAWLSEYFAILAQRHSPELHKNSAEHMDRLWGMLERNHPEQWQQNRDLWSGFVNELGNSMTAAQRNSTGKWLATMGNTLRVLARADVKLSTSYYDAGCSPGEA